MAWKSSKASIPVHKFNFIYFLHLFISPQTLGAQIASTPLFSIRKGQQDLLNLQSTISPIYDTIDDKSYTVNRSSSSDQNTTVINSATIVRKSAVKRDILAPKGSPAKNVMGPSEPQRNVLSRMSAGKDKCFILFPSSIPFSSVTYFVLWRRKL